jgi:hypothetical protein
VGKCFENEEEESEIDATALRVDEGFVDDFPG